MGSQERIKHPIYLGGLVFGLAMSASRFTSKKVIKILVAEESIMPNETQPALIRMAVSHA